LAQLSSYSTMDGVAPPANEHEHLSREPMLPEHRLNECRSAVNRLAHAGQLDAHLDANRRQRDNRRAASSVIATWHEHLDSWRHGAHSRCVGIVVRGSDRHWKVAGPTRRELRLSWRLARVPRALCPQTGAPVAQRRQRQAAWFVMRESVVEIPAVR
jgi:hypothetical protein